MARQLLVLNEVALERAAKARYDRARADGHTEAKKMLPPFEEVPDLRPVKTDARARTTQEEAYADLAWSTKLEARTVARRVLADAAGIHPSLLPDLVEPMLQRGVVRGPVRA